MDLDISSLGFDKYLGNEMGGSDPAVCYGRRKSRMELEGYQGRFGLSGLSRRMARQDWTAIGGNRGNFPKYLKTMDL